jgi:hypothetical protein
MPPSCRGILGCDAVYFCGRVPTFGKTMSTGRQKQNGSPKRCYPTTTIHGVNTQRIST